MVWKRWFLLNMAIFGIYARFLGGKTSSQKGQPHTFQPIFWECWILGSKKHFQTKIHWIHLIHNWWYTVNFSKCLSKIKAYQGNILNETVFFFDSASLFLGLWSKRYTVAKAHKHTFQPAAALDGEDWFIISGSKFKFEGNQSRIEMIE